MQEGAVGSVLVCGCAVKKQSVGCCLLAMAPEGKQEKAAGGLSART